MPFIRCLFSIFIVLCLTACLAVTGPARDPFDEDHEESSIDLGEKLNTLRANPSSVEPEATATGVDTAVGVESKIDSASEATTPESVAVQPVTAKTETLPTDTSPIAGQQDADQKEYAEFLIWKSERDTSSDEYQEFLEYQEYKKWLEFQKTKNPSEG